MRASVIGSSVIHLALLVALFYVRSPVSLVVPPEPALVSSPVPPP